MRSIVGALGVSVAVAVVLGAAVADATQQATAAKKLLVKSTPSGTKKILYKAQNSTGTVMGDPTAGSGATFNLQLTPGGTQCFSMPASGWSANGPQGFKYKDPQLANGPVKVAQIKATPSGNFQIKIIAKGSGITVTPGNPTTSYATNFSISGGDEYCGSSGSATPAPNDANTFNVVNDDGTACSLGPC